jgi:hypothetical protein
MLLIGYRHRLKQWEGCRWQPAGHFRTILSRKRGHEAKLLAHLFQTIANSLLHNK